GNVTDPISHRDDGQSECECNSKDVDGRRSGSHPADDYRATSEENQRKGSDEFCSRLSHVASLGVIDRFTTLQQVGFLRTGENGIINTPDVDLVQYPGNSPCRSAGVTEAAARSPHQAVLRVRCLLPPSASG